MSWAENVARILEKNSHRFLTRKPEGRKPLERQGERWQDYVKVDFEETGWEKWDWTHLSQDREVAMKLRVP